MRGPFSKRTAMSAFLAASLLSACGTTMEGGGCWGPTLKGSEWDGKTGVLEDGGIDCAVACTAAFRDYEVMPDAGCIATIDGGVFGSTIGCELVLYCSGA